VKTGQTESKANGSWRKEARRSIAPHQPRLRSKPDCRSPYARLVLIGSRGVEGSSGRKSAHQRQQSPVRRRKPPRTRRGKLRILWCPAEHVNIRVSEKVAGNGSAGLTKRFIASLRCALGSVGILRLSGFAPVTEAVVSLSAIVGSTQERPRLRGMSLAPRSRGVCVEVGWPLRSFTACDVARTRRDRTPRARRATGRARSRTRTQRRWSPRRASRRCIQR